MSRTDKSNIQLTVMTKTVKSNFPLKVMPRMDKSNIHWKWCQEWLKFLGVYFDPSLNFKFHISTLKKKLSRALYALRTVKNTLNQKSLLLIYNSICHCHLCCLFSSLLVRRGADPFRYSSICGKYNFFLLMCKYDISSFSCHCRCT